jgi:hypothetical protein
MEKSRLARGPVNMVVGGFPPDLHEVFTSCDAVLLLLIRQTV